MMITNIKNNTNYPFTIRYYDIHIWAPIADLSQCSIEAYVDNAEMNQLFGTKM